MESAIKIFDAAMRLGRSRDHIVGAPVSVNGLLAEMDIMGIHEALVWHADSQHYDAQSGNQQLLSELSGCTRLHPCWIFIPHETDEMQHPSQVVDNMLKSGVKAARIFPREHLFMLRSWNIAPLLETLSEHMIPLFVDFGIKGWSDEFMDWDGIYEMGTAFPEIPLILTCVNISSDRRLIPLMKRLTNLYVETSYYTVHRGIELLVSKVGAERILFGAGLPLRAPGPALSALRYSLISDNQKVLVAGENLRRILNKVIL